MAVERIEPEDGPDLVIQADRPPTLAEIAQVMIDQFLTEHPLPATLPPVWAADQLTADRQNMLRWAPVVYVLVGEHAAPDWVGVGPWKGDEPWVRVHANARWSTVGAAAQAFASAGIARKAGWDGEIPSGASYAWLPGKRFPRGRVIVWKPLAEDP